MLRTLVDCHFARTVRRCAAAERYNSLSGECGVDRQTAKHYLLLLLLMMMTMSRTYTCIGRTHITHVCCTGRVSVSVRRRSRVPHDPSPARPGPAGPARCPRHLLSRFVFPWQRTVWHQMAVADDAKSDPLLSMRHVHLKIRLFNQ